ncbi:MAG: DUF3857 domain-containing protein [Bacteroidota bacterium]|nr:DUF3857 domain-containing protein [Bacteroidota bacterium]
MRKTLLLLIAVVPAVSTLSAQQAAIRADRSAIIRDYNAVISDLEYVYEFDIVRDSLKVTQHFSKETEMLTEFTRLFAEDEIYFDSFSTVRDLEAYTMVPDKKGFEKIPVTLFNESNDPGGGIFYDDSKSLSFVYPSLRKGATTKLQYNLVHHNPRFLNKIVFQSYLPVMNARFTVKAHRDVRLEFRFFNCDEGFLKYSSYSRGQYNYHVWETKDVLPYRYLNSANYSILYDSPHVSVSVEEVKLRDTTLRYFSTVTDLYRFYYSLLPPEEDTPSLPLKELVESITGNLYGRDKVKAIYYWVQDNIKYVAYSEGYQGFIPATAEEVFSRRFGDCKGKSSLIRKMIEIAGLKASYAWVGTRELPYRYSELPLPSVDNHMVVAYKEEDSVYILDGTFRFIDFGMYPFNIQGKEVLIGVDSDKYFIFRVPVSGEDESIVYDSVNIQLTGDLITGNGFRSHSGFNRYELAHAMEGVKPADYNRRVTSLFTKGNNKFSVDSCTFHSLYQHEVPASVSYSFNIADYARKVNNQVFINLNLDRSVSESKIDTTARFAPVVNDFRYTEHQITRFRIPDGYEISYLPDNDVIDNEIISAYFRYSVDDGYITLDKEIRYKFLLLQSDQVKLWNSTVDRLNGNYRLTVALNKSVGNS